jgi:hypothetical protein
MKPWKEEPDTIPCPPPDEYDVEIVFEDPDATDELPTMKMTQTAVTEMLK